MKNFIISAILLSILFASCSKSETEPTLAGDYEATWQKTDGETGVFYAQVHDTPPFTNFVDIRLTIKYDNGVAKWEEEQYRQMLKYELTPFVNGEIARIKLNRDVLIPNLSDDNIDEYLPREYKLYEHKGKKVIESLAPSTSGLRVIR